MQALIAFFLIILVVGYMFSVVFGQGISEIINGVPHDVAEAAYREILDLENCYYPSDQSFCPKHYVQSALMVADRGITTWCVMVNYSAYGKDFNSDVVVSKNSDGQIDQSCLRSDSCPCP